MNVSIKPLLLSALLIEPLAGYAQTALIQFRFTEKTGTSVANTGSLGGTGTVTPAGSSAMGQPGVSGLAADYGFNNTAAGMGAPGAPGGVNANVSAVGTAKKSLTLQGWFKSGTAIGNGARLMDNYDVANVKGFGLRGPSSGESAGALYFLADGQTVNSGANTYGDTGDWVFFAVTYDYSSGVNSNNVRFYKGTMTSPVVQVGGPQTFAVNVQSIDAAATTNLTVGNYANIRPYGGYLDNIRVYGDTTTGAGALTLAQLETLRQADVANASKTADVTVAAGSMIRDDIEAKTFGGGVDMRTPQFKDVMTGTGANAATRTMFQNMKMGTMRFPQGTSSLFYYWKNPPASYIDHGDANRPDPFPGLTGNMLITPAQMYTYTDMNPLTDSLHMDLLFQVNSFSYVVNNWTYTYINKNKTDGSKLAEISSSNPDNLTGAANYAADWVYDNLVNHPANIATYWEVGNEDWVWWTPAQYAQIFNAYAVAMKAKAAQAGAQIKLLAQTTTGTNTGAGGIVNTNAWTSQMVAAMNANGWDKNNVYALSEHEYLNGNATGTLPDGTPIARDFSNYPASAEGQRMLLTENMFAKVQANSRINFLKGQIASLAPAWKIWMTEFNVVQNDATTTASNPNGIMKRLHDLGHGLVLADWTGKMLESGVERILVHSFDHHPYYSIIDYVNSGGSIPAPIKTVPGYAFGIFPQEFGKKMVQSTVANNPQFSSPNEGNYNQVSVYSSVREADNTLRVIAINRSANSGIRLTLGCTGRTIAAAPAQYTRRELYSANLLDSNFNAPDTVKWSSAVSLPITGSVIDGIVLKEHSATLFVIPLAP